MSVSMRKKISDKGGLGIGITRWGPAYWSVLERCAFQKDITKSEFSALVRNFVKILPCSICQSHASLYIDKNSPDTSEELLSWLNVFHNNVNAQHNKPQVLLGDFLELYKQKSTDGSLLVHMFEFIFITVAIIQPTGYMKVSECLQMMGDIHKGDDAASVFRKIALVFSSHSLSSSEVYNKTELLLEIIQVLSDFGADFDYDFFIENFIPPSMYSHFGIDSSHVKHADFVRKYNERTDNRTHQPAKRDTVTNSSNSVTSSTNWVSHNWWWAIAIPALLLVSALIFRVHRYRRSKLQNDLIKAQATGARIGLDGTTVLAPYRE